MSLAAHRRSRPTSLSTQTLAAFVLSLAGGCVPAAEDNRSATSGGRGGSAAASGGSSGSGGQAPGGSGGSGGSGSGGASAGTGGSGSGGSGSGGAGSGGRGGSGGGSGDASAGTGGRGPDGGGEAGGSETAPAATFMDVANNVISNCVFCHPGEVEVIRNTDFADSAALYDILLSTTPTPFVPAGCAFKRLVVPGKPMESLLYLKLAGPPANCGARMPLPAEAGKPFVPIRQLDLDLVRDWIAAGAPR
jgi:hypothetical protein